MDVGARRFGLVWLALALPGCAGSIHRPTVSVSPPDTRLTVVPEGLAEIPVRVVLRTLPSYAEGVRVTGFDAQQKTIYGPNTLPPNRELNLAEVPTRVSLLRVEPFIGHTVLTRASVELDLSQAPSLTVEDPATVAVHRLRGLSVESPQPSLAAGDTEQLQVFGEFSDEAHYDLSRLVRWQTSQPETLAVSQSGQAQALQVGTASADCRLDELTAGISLSVTSPRLVSLVVTPGASSLSTLTTQEFHAEGVFSDHSTQDLTGQVGWDSTNPGVAMVDSNGVAATQGVGSTLIEARLGDCSGQTELAVSGPTVLNLSLGPATQTVASQSSLLLHALATLSDGTIRDVTPLAIWNSSVPSMLNLTGPGEGQVQGVGTSTVSANFGGFESSTEVSTASAPPITPPPLNRLPEGFTVPPQLAPPPGYAELPPQANQPAPEVQTPPVYDGDGGGYILAAGGYGFVLGGRGSARSGSYRAGLQSHHFGASFVRFGGARRR